VYPLVPWSPKQSKMAQPELDFIAPEIQRSTLAYTRQSSDMFSLGLLICSVYNNGKSLIQAANSTATYLKQVDQVCNGYD